MAEPQGYEPTTTHAEWGAGDPHLRITRDGERFVFHLEADEVRVGSAEGNELRLADTDPVHATISHDKRDEYVLTLHGAGEMNANPRTAETGSGVGADSGTNDTSEILRTGAHFTAGPWTLVFGREEFADHGRPFGGREGGELDDQAPQPVRPDYTGEGVEPDTGLEVKDG
ncbi:MAG TPA: hypothetical protein DIW46_03485 [Microbacterium sp.]|uniref:hypothetical protein n=1 Tax=Microbacterium sp. TaxID=51671 RepID=UPI000EBFB72C|nr:hypothetical protein [Microbacterium sp.]